jgi:hypothetical protein
MRYAVLFLLAGALAAAPALRFEITDERGKKASGITIEPGAPDAGGWYPLTLAKSKGDPVLLWPFDGRAKAADGPSPIAAIVIQRGAEKALTNRRVLAAIAVPVVLGLSTLDDAAKRTGLTAPALSKAIDQLATSTDSTEKGVALLYRKKPAEAADELGRALKDRQRQLTRVPSEIYAIAMLQGTALLQSNKADDAAVAFLTALRQRPSDEPALKARREALIKAGKPEAAEQAR